MAAQQKFDFIMFLKSLLELAELEGHIEVTDTMLKDILVDIKEKENQWINQLSDKVKEQIDFAKKMSKAMTEISSSHVYFMMQMAFEGEGKEFEEGHMSWEDCVEKWEAILND